MLSSEVSIKVHRATSSVSFFQGGTCLKLLNFASSNVAVFVVGYFDFYVRTAFVDSVNTELQHFPLVLNILISSVRETVL